MAKVNGNDAMDVQNPPPPPPKDEFPHSTKDEFPHSKLSCFARYGGKFNHHVQILYQGLSHPSTR